VTPVEAPTGDGGRPDNNLEDQMSKVRNAIVIQPDGVVRRVTIRCYDDMNKAVGGWIEALALPWGDGDQSAYVNEDGIALGLPFNRLATDLCTELQVGLMPGDYIKGNMLVLGPPDDDEGESTDIDEALAELLLSRGK
jgi:hypothetical protein